MQAFEAWLDSYAGTRVVTIGATSLKAAHAVAKDQVREGEVLRGVVATGEVAEHVAETEHVVFA